MYADYERLVFEYYQWKKSNGELPLNLVIPTPSKLRSECENVCRERFQKRDEQIIRDFFGKSGDYRVCLQVIQQCKAEKFKPLINFLNNDTSKTNERNILLLAWLIDFPYRPFEFDKVYPPITEIIAEQKPPPATGTDVPIVYTGLPEEGIKEEKRDTEEQVGGGKAVADKDGKLDNKGAKVVVPDDKEQMGQLRKKRRLRNVAMVGVLLAVTGTSGYWWWDSKQRTDLAQGKGSCMYWAKDHFQPIPCNQSIPNTLVVALDTVRVKSFKKITRPDTITNRAKGMVWYSKINNEIEFFTADGEHPVVVGRRLKPVSDYIIEKYVHPGMSLNQ